MKVGDRQQQGRTNTGGTGKNPKEICPACEVEYLKTLYYEEKGKKKVFGKGCPNENCTFCRKKKEIKL